MKEERADSSSETRDLTVSERSAFNTPAGHHITSSRSRKNQGLASEHRGGGRFAISRIWKRPHEANTGIVERSIKMAPGSIVPQGCPGRQVMEEVAVEIQVVFQE